VPIAEVCRGFPVFSALLRHYSSACVCRKNLSAMKQPTIFAFSFAVLAVKNAVSNPTPL